MDTAGIEHRLVDRQTLSTTGSWTETYGWHVYQHLGILKNVPGSFNGTSSGMLTLSFGHQPCAPVILKYRRWTGFPHPDKNIGRDAKSVCW